MKSEGIKATFSNLGRVAAVSIVMLLLLSPQSTNAQLANSPWPTFHGNAKRTGLSPYDTSHVDGTVKWKFKAEEGIESSPTIGKDGTLYFGDHKNNIYAVDRNGKLKWKVKTGDPVYEPDYKVWKGTAATATVARDGTVYIPTTANYLYAFNRAGKEKWRFSLPVSADYWAAPAIGNDGTIYVLSGQIGPVDTNNKLTAGLYALTPQGKERWFFPFRGGALSSPAVGKDGTIYIGASVVMIDTGILYAINPDGTEKWKYTSPSEVESTPAIGKDGTIYYGVKDNKLYAITSKGKLKWTFKTGKGEVFSTPAIAKDGTIYFGAEDNKFYALNPNGTKKWSYSLPNLIDCSPAIGAEGTIYFGVSGGNGQDDFYALNPDGTKKWSYKTDSGSVASAPSIGSDGTVYIGSWDGKLYAFGGPPVVDEKPEDVKEVKDEEEKTEEEIPITRMIGILGVLLIALGISIFSVLKKQ